MTAPAHGLTEEELAKLTPAELAAVTDDLSEDEASLAAGAPGVKVEPDADPLKGPAKTEVVEDTDPAAKAKADADGAKKPDAEPAAEATTDADGGENEPLAVPFQARAVDPERVKTARTEIDEKAKAELSEVMKKYEEGELTQTEMLERRDEINGLKHRGHAEIDRAIQESEMAKKHEVQVKVSLWDREVKAFLKDHKAYQTDVLYDALDLQVRKIAADPANANMTDRQILDQAHKNLSAVMKVGDVEAPVDPKKAAEEALKAAKDKRKADLSGVPKTLAGIPAAAPQAAETEEFAHLDSLQAQAETGDADAQAAYERELAKLKPDAADRYLRAA
jgi:hypothetical protein